VRLYFLAVEAIVDIDTVLVVKRDSGRNSQRNAFVGRTEERLGFYFIINKAFGVKLAEAG
jgi:hypothetical protein